MIWGEIGKVIKLNEKQEVLLMFLREGLSVRAISRKTGLHRSTVSKYVHQYEESRQRLAASIGGNRAEQVDIIGDIVNPAPVRRKRPK